MLENDFLRSSQKVSYYLREYIEILKLQISSIEKDDMEKLETQTEAGKEAVRSVFVYKKSADALWNDISRLKAEKGSGSREAYSMDSYNTYISDINSLVSESAQLDAVCAEKLKLLMGKYRGRLIGVRKSLFKINNFSPSPPSFLPPRMLDISI